MTQPRDRQELNQDYEVDLGFSHRAFAHKMKAKDTPPKRSIWLYSVPAPNPEGHPRLPETSSYSSQEVRTGQLFPFSYVSVSPGDEGFPPLPCLSHSRALSARSRSLRAAPEIDLAIHCLEVTLV